MLRWKTRSRGTDETYVVIEGDLTEMESLVGLEVDTSRVVLNLARVRYINSEGSRRLLNLFRDLAGQGEVTAELCSPVVVELFNMVPLMTAYVRVHSVIIPTECLECMHESDIRMPLPENGHLPAVTYPPCPKCGGDMEPSVALDRYLAFVEDLGKDRPPEA
jgi:hypothetical protein